MFQELLSFKSNISYNSLHLEYINVNVLRLIFPLPDYFVMGLYINFKSFISRIVK